MKKKSLSMLIALSLVTSTIFSTVAFADTTATTTTPVTTAPASTYAVAYEGQVQNIGWQSPVTTTGDQADISTVDIAGTVQKALRVEAVKIAGTNLPAGASITYQAQVQNEGWLNAVTSDSTTTVDNAPIGGTVHKGERVEAFKLTLNGLPGYAIKYQTQVQNIGWQDAVTTENGTDISNAALAGTVHLGLRMEALRIQIVKTDAEKAAEVTAINAVQTAEGSQLASDVATAKTAVQAVQDTVENAALTARINAINVKLQVASVSAINGNQLAITFTQPIDATTAIETSGPNAGTLVDGIFTISAADSNSHTIGSADTFKASLSSDKKTLTVTADTYLSGNYSVNVKKDLISSTDGTQTVGAYSTFINVADTTRPTITGVTYTDVKHAVVHFSEPVQAGVTPTYARADGTALNAATLPTAVIDPKDPSAYDIDLSSVQPADQGQNINFTFVGIKDIAGNLLNPNPANVTVKYDNSNTSKVTVSSVTVTGSSATSSSFDIKFSGALTTLPAVTIGATPETVTQDATDLSLVHVTTTAALTDLNTVSISGFAGLNYVTGDPTSQTVNFSVNTAAPAITGTAVQKIGGVEYLVLTYNKNVVVGTFGAPTGTYFNPSTSITTTGITYTSGAGAYGLTASQLLPYGATTTNQIKIDLTNLANAGTYTISLPTGFTDDTYNNQSAAVSNISFTRTSNTVTAAPTATVLPVGGNNNQVFVSFDKNVDTTTALNTSNYSVEGATISGAILTANGAGSATVLLTLANDSNTYTGAHLVTVSGVKSSDGVVMNAYSNAVNLTENVRPTVTAAKVTDAAAGTITLTFSKAVTNGTANDFDVYIGGTKVSGVTNPTTAGVNTLVITLPSSITAAQVSSGIVVKPGSTVNVTDADSNALNLTQVSVTQ